MQLKKGNNRPSVCAQRYSTAALLARELRTFNKEQGLATDIIPAASILRAADRLDLLSEIQRYGGARSLGPTVAMRTQRGPGFQNMAAAVDELRVFVQQSHIDDDDVESRQPWHMPTQRELRTAGRYDLLTAITKYGQSELALAADLKQNVRGNPRQVVAGHLMPRSNKHVHMDC